MKNAFLAISILSAASAPARPLVDPGSVTLTQDAQSRVVTVSYDLQNEPAVIVVDVQTNVAADVWASVGTATLGRFSGENNCVVRTLGRHTLTWKPHRDPAFRGRKTDCLRAVVTAYPTNSPPDWLVVDLMKRDIPRYYESPAQFPDSTEVTNWIYKTEKLLLRRIPAAGVEFRAGEPIRQQLVNGAFDYAFPHQVVLSEDYYMAVFMLTAKQSDCFMNDRRTSAAPYEDSVMHPTIQGYNSWRGTPTDGWKGWPQEGHSVAASSYLDLLRRRVGLDLDFPTEAQWEFAARAGTTTACYDGSHGNSATVQEIAWFLDNNPDKKQTFPVGLKKPNAFGLYDMLGNYMEWCLDWFEKRSSSALEIDPAGPLADTTSTDGNHRIAHGGWAANSISYLAAGRKFNIAATGSAGVRLVCPAIAK